ncbi:MAG TPA: DUF2783 domain-containing protein [Steroidobacteraceae bacterium]|nr:DUF2783 domain-containing protein [Steroidobacteraceae bacterium]
MTEVIVALHAENRLRDPDACYAALAGTIDALGDERATAFLAALVLILANEVGNQEVVLEAIEAARP